jgi:hypothetical protein
MSVLVERDASLPFWIGSLFGVAVASTIASLVLQFGVVCSAT